MKRVFFTAIILMILGQLTYSQKADIPYEVATWSGFRTAAINYTFDDGCANQFKIAIPMFDEYDFKLTLFTVTSWVGDWKALKSASANGHEVASHTVTHPNLSSIDLLKQENEHKNSKETIEKQITDKKCITSAYPFCVPGNDSIYNKYYISARGCQGFIEGKTPGSYFNISSVVCGDQGTVNNLNNFKTKFAEVSKKNGWCVFLFHGIDKDGGYSPITSLELHKSVAYLAARKSKFWVTTFLNTTLYSKERNVVEVKEISASDTLFTLQVTDSLNDSIYNFPISIRRPLPDEWPSATVTQNEKAVPYRIVQVDTFVYLTFDVIPDAGEVKICKNNVPVTPEIDSIPADNMDPEIVAVEAIKNHQDVTTIFENGKLFVKFSQQQNAPIKIELYDFRGIAILSQHFHQVVNKQLVLDLYPLALKKGLYLIGISDGKNNWGRKIVKS